MIRKLYKSGSSFQVYLPMSIIKELDLKEGDEFRVRDIHGSIILTPLNQKIVQIISPEEQAINAELQPQPTQIQQPNIMQNPAANYPTGSNSTKYSAPGSATTTTNDSASNTAN